MNREIALKDESNIEGARKDDSFAEIDMSNSVIELVLHRPDGTLQRKKYQNHQSCCQNDTPQR